MIKLNNLSDKVSKNSFVKVTLEHKYPNLIIIIDEEVFHLYLWVTIDCTVKDLCEMFLDFSFKNGDIDLFLLEGSDPIKKQDFMDIRRFPNYKYVWMSLQNF